MNPNTVVLPAAIQPDKARGTVVAVALAAWFLLVVALGAAEVFVGPPGKPPMAIGLGVSMPLLIFFAWMKLSPAFRAFVLSLDLRLVAGIQAWRFAGMGFLDLYAFHVLPAMFALPAGLGDMAIGATAPWIMLRLARRPDFAASPAFVRWNLLGMLDLVVAVSLGALGTILRAGGHGEISTAPMASLPLLLIPAFLVPVFFMLHITALLQHRQLVRSRA